MKDMKPDFENWFAAFKKGCWLIQVDEQMRIIKGYGHRNRKDIKLKDGCKLISLDKYFNEFLTDMELKIIKTRKYGRKQDN